MKALRSVVSLVVVAATLVVSGAGAVDAVALAQPATLLVKAEDLVERLASPSASERKEAREGLLALGTVVVPALILATESESATLRWEAVNLLGSLGDLRGADAVLRVATTDPDVHARWRANWAITNLDDGTVVPRLIAALGGENRAVAWNAAVALSLFGALEAVPLLHEGLEIKGWVQWEAVNALGRIWNDTTVSELVVVLEEGSEDVRREAALSLGRIGGGVALAALLKALGNDLSPEVRWRAAMMIGHIGEEVIVELLIEIRTQESHPLAIDHIDEAIERLAHPNR